VTLIIDVFWLDRTKLNVFVCSISSSEVHIKLVGWLGLWPGIHRQQLQPCSNYTMDTLWLQVMYVMMQVIV